MKHTVLALSLLTSTLFVTCSETKKPFQNYKTSSIEESADLWVKNYACKLNCEKQLTYLNLFIIFLEQQSNSIELLMKCIQTIQEDSSLQETAEVLGMDTETHVIMYEKEMRKKQSQKKPTPETLKKFEQQLEEKIAELIMYIYAMYYTKLYSHIEGVNPKALMYIFDKNGIIAPENRTQVLPKITF